MDWSHLSDSSDSSDPSDRADIEILHCCHAGGLLLKKWHLKINQKQAYLYNLQNISCISIQISYNTKQQNDIRIRKGTT